MKNILGHDNESEIKTIIKRLREKRFKVILCEDDCIIFKIILIYRNSVPISNTTTQEILFRINRHFMLNRYDFFIHQERGNGNRLIDYSDGIIIWGILKDSIK